MKTTRSLMIENNSLRNISDSVLNYLNEEITNSMILYNNDVQLIYAILTAKNDFQVVDLTVNRRHWFIVKRETLNLLYKLEI